MLHNHTFFNSEQLHLLEDIFGISSTGRLLSHLKWRLFKHFFTLFEHISFLTSEDYLTSLECQRYPEWVLNNISSKMEAALCCYTTALLPLGWLVPIQGHSTVLTAVLPPGSPNNSHTELARVPVLSRQICSVIFAFTLHRKFFRSPGLWSAWLPFKILSGNSSRSHS